jgi:hypothetical protein
LPAATLPTAAELDAGADDAGADEEAAAGALEEAAAAGALEEAAAAGAELLGEELPELLLLLQPTMPKPATAATAVSRIAVLYIQNPLSPGRKAPVPYGTARLLWQTT